MSSLPGEKIHHIHRIVICTLDSLYSAVGIHELVEMFPDRVALICVSQRYGGKYGSFFKQLITNWRRAGFSFVQYLSFHFIYFYPFLFLSDVINFLLDRRKCVYSIKQVARRFNIPLLYTRNPNNHEVVSRINALEPDIIVSAYFDHIIRQELIKIPRFGVINIHTALLPDFRGPFPSLWPMIYNTTSTGVSIHYINSEELDTGPILLQKEYPRIKNESVLGADCRLFREGIQLIREVLVQIENGTARAVAQEKKGRYFSFPRRTDLVSLRKNGIKLVKIMDFVGQFF